MIKHLRDPFSGISHLLAAVAAVVGTILITLRGQSARSPLFVYGLSLVALYAASATYHLARVAPHRLAVLRKFDHSAIFLLIAGTYTPVAALALTGAYRLVVLIAVWVLAAAGIIYKVFTIGRYRWLYTALYITMGWLGVLLIGPLSQRLPAAAFGWMLTGGLVYTAGALLYILKRPNPWPGVFGFHEIWHLFVIGGSVCHFVFQWLYVAPLRAL